MIKHPRQALASAIICITTFRSFKSLINTNFIDRINDLLTSFRFDELMQPSLSPRALQYKSATQVKQNIYAAAGLIKNLYNFKDLFSADGRLHL